MERRRNGFTLVEMLIVLLIIGVLLGITLLSPITKSTHKIVQEQAARLQVLFAQARDKALLENAEFGFSVDGSGTYQWWVLPLESKDWERLQEKPFQPYRLPDGFRVELETDEIEDAVANWSGERPAVVFYTDREATPFSLSIIPKDDHKQTLVLQTDGLSDVEIFR